jgi:hypothetical protein
MKKILTLMAVATIPAMLGGCAACCPPTGLCSWCPCNCFQRQPDPCPPAPVYAAPLATACPPTTCCPPAAMPQYAAPMAAPFTAAPTYVQPQMATCCPQQPMYYQAAPMQYAEPSCGCSYAEQSCGAPFMGMGMGMGMGMVSYGPEIPVEYGPSMSGCCEPGMAPPMTPPAPEAYVEPRPAAE